MSNDEIIFKGKTDKFYKVIVVGDPAVGKKELIAKFATNQFEEKYLPTLGFSILKEAIKLKDYNATVNLMFWDIAGQPQFYMLQRSYFNGADGMLLVFDLTRSSTFSNVNNWYSSAVKFGLSGVPRILIGNKIDLKDERKIILPMAEHLSENLNAPYYETSALTGENVKEVFEKIAELVYLAPEREDASNNEPLISKNYEEPSNDKHRVEKSSYKTEKPLDWKSVLLKEVQPSSSASDSMELDKREKRALKTIFKYFNESKVVYYKPEKSETDLLRSIETGDLVVLTSKLKYQKLFPLPSDFFYILIIGGILIGMIPGMRNFATIVLIITIGIISRAITTTMFLRHYFIVLNSHGIYYKKIRSPRFIPWTDVVEIIGYSPGLHKNERTVGLSLKSKKKVRFKEINYQYKHKFLMFEDAFRTFKFRQCPFYRFGRHRGQFQSS